MFVLHNIIITNRLSFGSEKTREVNNVVLQDPCDN